MLSNTQYIPCKVYKNMIDGEKAECFKVPLNIK